MNLHQCPPDRIRNLRVVGHVNDSLISAANQLGLVLDAKDVGSLAVDLLRGGRVDDLDVDGTREAFLTILAPQSELDALTTLQSVEAGNVTDTNGLGTVPDLLAPADVATMQVVCAVVRGQGVRLAAVEGVDLGATDAVGNAANGLAKVGAVVALILGGRGEALDNVDATDLDGLDDGAKRQELKGGVSSHVYDLLFSAISTMMVKAGW